MLISICSGGSSRQQKDGRVIEIAIPNLGITAKTEFSAFHPQEYPVWLLSEAGITDLMRPGRRNLYEFV
ncbi:hypothetical protein AB1K84_11475 [Mesobacillus foraminis]|uniref:hypothetical protein n=1 Tax=Mesobacillus foraminis TaxID=279826 RepID=UPI0039A18BD9